MLHFSRLSIALLIIVCSFLPARAQDSLATRATSLREGMKALQFQIGSNFYLYSFSGGMLSLKRQTSATTAQRFSVSVDIQASSGDDGYWYSDTTTVWREPTRSSYSVALSFAPTVYLDTKSDIHPFIGGGPTVGYSHSESDERSFHSEGTPVQNMQKRHSDTNAWNIGGIAFIGVEWFASSSIGITAEYGCSLLYSKRNTKNTNEIHYTMAGAPPSTATTGGSEMKSLNFSGTSVRFGLSAYF